MGEARQDIKEMRGDIGKLNGRVTGLDDKFVKDTVFVAFKKDITTAVDDIRKSKSLKYNLALIGLILSLIANMLVIYERFRGH